MNLSCEENLELNRRETEGRVLTMRSLPAALDIALTGRCNLDCLMCTAAKSQNTYGPEILREIAPLLPYLTQLTWTGGEPLLVSGFEQMLDEAGRNGQLVQRIFTNGLLITPALARALLRNRTILYVSTTSADPVQYEKTRRGARYQQLLSSLSCYAEQKKAVGGGSSMELSVVVMRSNYRQLRDFADFAAQWGFGRVVFYPINDPRGIGETIFQDNDKEARNYLEREMDSVLAHFEKMGLQAYSLLPWPKSAQGEASAEDFCRLPWQQLYLDSNRNIFPSCFCHVPIGRLGEGTLPEIWNSEQMREYRRRAAGKGRCLCHPSSADIRRSRQRSRVY